MNPLSKWPDDILRQCLFTQDEDSPRYYWDEKEPVYAPQALAELLRRKERETIERCAAVCREMARKEHALVANGSPHANIEKAWSHEHAADCIEELTSEHNPLYESGIRGLQ